MREEKEQEGRAAAGGAEVEEDEEAEEDARKARGRCEVLWRADRQAWLGERRPPNLWWRRRTKGSHRAGEGVKEIWGGLLAMVEVGGSFLDFGRV